MGVKEALLENCFLIETKKNIAILTKTIKDNIFSE